MVVPERPLSLSHVEQRPVASFQEFYPSSSISQLPPFAGTSRPQGESSAPDKDASIGFQSLPTRDFLIQRNGQAKGYDNVFMNEQRPRPQVPPPFNANLPIRRKPLASKAIQANEKVTPVVMTYPPGAQAPTPTSNQYKKPTDSQLFTNDRSYDLASTIYCECEPRLPARRLQTQSTEINHRKWYYVCQKAYQECCEFLFCDDGAKDGEKAAVTYSTRPEDLPSLLSRAPSEPPPYSLALLHIPSDSKKGGSDPTTTAYTMSTPSYFAHSPSARGILRHMDQDFAGISKSNTLPFVPAGETQSKDIMTTNPRQGQCTPSMENSQGGTENTGLLHPNDGQSSNINAEVTHYHPGKNRLESETEYSPTKKRKLASFMDGCTQKMPPQVTNQVKNGTNVETVDLYNQTLSRAEAHEMLDRLIDLKVFIKDVRSRLRELSSQVDTFQRSFTNTRSSVEVGAKNGAFTAIADHGASIEQVKNAILPDVQAPVTPRHDKDPTTTISSPIFNLEEIAIPLPGTQSDVLSVEMSLQPVISTFMSLDDRSPLRKLVRYDPPRSTTSYPNRFLEQALLNPLPRLQNYAKGLEPAGLIYMYSIQGSFGYVKIGYTARKVEVRLKEWQDTCKHTPHLIYPQTPEEQTSIPYVRRVEALIHAELRHCRVRELQCLCKEMNAWGRQKQHVEWFEIEVHRAKEVAMRWSNWIRSNPYEEISPQNWVLRAEHRANIGELARPTPRAEFSRTSNASSRPLLPKSASAPSKSFLGPGSRTGLLARRSLSPRL